LRWHQTETYAFLHFTVNTFTDKEWGYGDEDPKLFHPTAFDADAMIEALKAGGLQGVILTCKHHDGFCLWPTRTSQHSVKRSSWRGGQGDVVREISQAAARHGLKFGVYVSPWDRNHAQYGHAQYVAAYREQLRELLTGYGPVFEVWHDGANGGDGFYGGAREKRTIDKRSYYGWPETWEMVRRLQPDAVIFSDAGPDVRWVGNEKGIAGETCWATHTPVAEKGGPASPGDADAKALNSGTRHGTRWMPAECDVSIRPGWFWHERENARVKTAAELMDLYLKSVGRGASFLLNVPPDRRGLLHENDVQSLREFGGALWKAFGKDLARGAQAKASQVRGGAREFDADKAIDGKAGTYWATGDAVRQAELSLEWPKAEHIEVVRVREEIRLGQRIERMAVDAFADGGWRTVGAATSVGACRIVKFAAPVETRQVRVRLESAAGAAVSEVAVFPAIL
jgi:alpha-L-fucosidase